MSAPNFGQPVQACHFAAALIPSGFALHGREDNETF
jgi:hypothetical protein